MELSGQLHILAALSLGKELLILIEYEALWAPESVWMLWIREKSLALVGNCSMIP
jgi:hypothetical protein